MSNIDLIWGGIQLMVFGMGMVYFFLVLMIALMSLMENLLTPFAGML